MRNRSCVCRGFSQLCISKENFPLSIILFQPFTPTDWCQEEKEKQRGAGENYSETSPFFLYLVLEDGLEFNSLLKVLLILTLINICRTNPRRRGKRSTRNTAGRRKRRRHLSRTQNWTDDRGLRRSPRPLQQFTKNRLFPSKNVSHPPQNVNKTPTDLLMLQLFTLPGAQPSTDFHPCVCFLFLDFFF